MNAPAPRHVLALLDDAAAAPDVIELSTALAQQLQRPLDVVYVESVPALVAAALPFTQVLAETRAQWTAFAPQDVESGYRAQLARLREIAARATMRRAVRWSLRTVRGALAQAVVELHAESDLMVVGTAGVRPPALARVAPVRRPLRIAVVTDDSPVAAQAREVAQQVAAALGGVLTVHRASGDAAAAAARDRHCDLLVLPRGLVAPAVLATLARPALVVG
ncbi:hypothetical protein MOJ79_09225 [Calidifontimicrobium sp. SYSU G02091]|uniref:hypothetical protein n=1 Tax=Calidifontimicrobium sp. SYSU G02091 TaxID=2926421 RepID=UPI001F539C7E|nr:hypothetical protein [Calidifontimicrobium sp. SYSU G02091]MCI1192019.1 hypothetical protein [Calidifontimicrobium sp. SYSU G02091]